MLSLEKRFTLFLRFLILNYFIIFSGGRSNDTYDMFGLKNSRGRTLYNKTETDKLLNGNRTLNLNKQIELERKHNLTRQIKCRCNTCHEEDTCESRSGCLSSVKYKTREREVVSETYSCLSDDVSDFSYRNFPLQFLP